MVAINYSGNVIEWTDGEWARLREIKDSPYWMPANHGEEMQKTSLNISALLLSRAKIYAKEHGTNISELLREMLKVIVE